VTLRLEEQDLAYSSTEGRSAAGLQYGCSKRDPPVQSDPVIYLQKRGDRRGLEPATFGARIGLPKPLFCWWLTDVSGCCALSGVRSGVKSPQRALPEGEVRHHLAASFAVVGDSQPPRVVAPCLRAPLHPALPLVHGQVAPGVECASVPARRTLCYIGLPGRSTGG